MSDLIGTLQTETVIGAAATRIAKSLQEYEKAQEQLKKLPDMLSDFTLRITQAEARLNDLKAAYDERKRQFNVELELHKKQSIEKIVTDYLAGETKIAVKHADYEQLKADYAKATQDQEQAINAAVSKAVGMAETRAKNVAEVREAQYQQKEAENKAQINSLTAQISALAKENASWQNQLNEERRASVERAKAGSVGSINVSAPGK